MPGIVGGMGILMSQLEAIGYQFTIEDIIPGANIILDNAQARCPVDTGVLQASGYIKAESDDVLIGFDAPYASYVEFGTYKMEAQPFLRPAIDESQDDALRAIVNSIESHMPRDLSQGGVQTQGNISGNLQP